jgi:Family of unknown function (DUF6502)
VSNNSEPNAGDQRAEWVLDACRRLLRPVIRLAMAYGLKHTQLSELLRWLMIDEAHALWVKRGVIAPNVSQLSVTAGINRKLVTAKVRAEGDNLPVTEASSASRVFTRWLQLAQSHPEYASLPVTGSQAAMSFESMAKKVVSGDVHHKTIVDELVRLGLAEENSGKITLLKDAFVPSDDERSMLAFAADNARDHLFAALSNVVGGKEPFLERAVYADGLALDGAWRVEQLARERWVQLHNELVAKMQEEVDQVGGEGEHRIRVGIYVYHEPVDADVQGKKND